MQCRLCRYRITSTSFISTQRTLWPIRQDKRLSTHGTFKNAGLKSVRDRFHGCRTLAGSKPMRSRFHGCGTFTSKEALDTNKTYHHTSFMDFMVSCK